MPSRQQGRVDQGRREIGGRIQNAHVPSASRDGEGSTPKPPPPTPTATPSSVTITGPFAVIHLGQTEQMNATVNDQNGLQIPGVSATNWLSSSPAVASVNGNGLVTALSAGTTNITGYSGAIGSQPFPISVDAIPATITLTFTTAAIQVPNTTQFGAVIKNALGIVIPGISVDAWHSSNGSVATVNSAGLVTSVLAGTTNITATITSPAITSNVVVVTVVDLVPSSIVVAPAAASVNVSSTQQMVATVKNVEGTALTQGVDAWHSSSPGVATVNGSGLVTAVAPGTTTITATITSPSLTSNGATITVPDTVPSSIAVTPSSATVNTGATQQLTAVVKNTGGGTLATPVSAWHSSDATKATVNSAGLVTGVAGGTTNITATITSPSVTSNTVAITVQAPVDNTPTAIAISPTAPTVALSGTQQFAAVVTNAGGVALNQAVSAWHSSNTNVATINSSGLLTVIAPGSTNVTATITSPSITSNTAVVTVPDTIPASIVVAPTIGIVNAAAMLQLTATVKNAAGGTLSQAVDAWHSSSPSVATVSGSGLVTGVLPGATNVTATITSPAVTSNVSAISVPSTGGGPAPGNASVLDFESMTASGPTTFTGSPSGNTLYNPWSAGITVAPNPTGGGNGARFTYANNPAGNFYDDNKALIPLAPNPIFKLGQEWWWTGQLYLDPATCRMDGGANNVERKYFRFGNNNDGSMPAVLASLESQASQLFFNFIPAQAWTIAEGTGSVHYVDGALFFVQSGLWYTIVVQTITNTDFSTANGVFRCWIGTGKMTAATAVSTGVKLVDHSDMRWSDPSWVGAYDPARYQWETWGVGYQGQSSAIPINEIRYWDYLSWANALVAL